MACRENQFEVVKHLLDVRKRRFEEAEEKKEGKKDPNGYKRVNLSRKKNYKISLQGFRDKSHYQTDLLKLTVSMFLRAFLLKTPLFTLV